MEPIIFLLEGVVKICSFENVHGNSCIFWLLMDQRINVSE